MNEMLNGLDKVKKSEWIFSFFSHSLIKRNSKENPFPLELRAVIIVE